MDVTKYRQEIEQEIYQRGYERVYCQIFPQYGLQEWAVIIEENEHGDGFNVFMTMDRASVRGKHACSDFESAKEKFFELMQFTIEHNQNTVLEGNSPYYKSDLWSKDVFDLHTDSIDAIGIQDGHLELLIIDEMCWTYKVEEYNLQQLQEKINNYIHYLESKQYVERYGDDFKEKVIHIACRYEPSDTAIAFFCEAQKALYHSDIRLKIVVDDEEVALAYDPNDVTKEDFAKLRKNGFYNALAGVCVVIFAVVLLVIMMMNNVDNGNIYKFRTVTFIVGVMYLGILFVSFKKVFRLQNEHPDWLAETSVFQNKIKEPREWKIRRWAVIIAVVSGILTSFVTFYQPGARVETDANTKQEYKTEVSNPMESESYKDGMEAINELKPQIETNENRDE